mmetsp:Transcript_10130/g.26233  ORF Transcript_10130/g.26233 Transcript_10130/m.26233 type:complete len:263 (-) Transcript_10130:219-1007(-)
MPVGTGSQCPAHCLLPRHTGKSLQLGCRMRQPKLASIGSSRLCPTCARPARTYPEYHSRDRRYAPLRPVCRLSWSIHRRLGADSQRPQQPHDWPRWLGARMNACGLRLQLGCCRRLWNSCRRRRWLVHQQSAAVYWSPWQHYGCCWAGLPVPRRQRGTPHCHGRLRHHAWRTRPASVAAVLMERAAGERAGVLGRPAWLRACWHYCRPSPAGAHAGQQRLRAGARASRTVPWARRALKAERPSRRYWSSMTAAVPKVLAMRH